MNDKKMLSDSDLEEFSGCGQWRCTVEEVQDAATRLLKEKRAAETALARLRGMTDVAAKPFVTSKEANTDAMRLAEKTAHVILDERDEAAVAFVFICDKNGRDGSSIATRPGIAPESVIRSIGYGLARLGATVIDGNAG